MPVSTTKNIDTGRSGEEYISMLTDPKRQEPRGSDYHRDELEKWYGDLMNTPLMKKKELTKKVSSAYQAKIEIKPVQHEPPLVHDIMF